MSFGWPQNGEMPMHQDSALQQPMDLNKRPPMSMPGMGVNTPGGGPQRMPRNSLPNQFMGGQQQDAMPMNAIPRQGPNGPMNKPGNNGMGSSGNPPPGNPLATPGNNMPPMANISGQANNMNPMGNLGLQGMPGMNSMPQQPPQGKPDVLGQPMYNGQQQPPQMMMMPPPMGPQSNIPFNMPPNMPSQGPHAAPPNGPPPAPSSAVLTEAVCNVWNKNLHYHMSLLRHYIQSYNFVTVDVKFPGVVARPIGTFHSTAEFHYQTLRSNIDLVEPIQVGITLTDASGNVPPGVNHLGTWQFNLKFDPETSMCSADGFEVMQQSGIDLDLHKQDGIEAKEFFSLLTTSGLLLNPNVTWITFYSGYDLGLLVSQLLNEAVPNQKNDYMSLIGHFFPHVWDVKLLVKAFNLSTKNYLHEIAEDFQLFRGSAWCCAGADSRLTALCFYEIMRTLGDHSIATKNRLFGLEDDAVGQDDDSSSQVQMQAMQAQVQAQAQAQAVVAAQAHAAATQGINAGSAGFPPRVMPMMPPYTFNPGAPAPGSGPQPPAGMASNTNIPNTNPTARSGTTYFTSV